MKLLKIKFYLPALIALLVAGSFLLVVNQVKATGAASFPQDTTVTMTVGDFTIQDGSDADSVTTDATKIAVTISSGQTFTLTSATRNLLINNGGYSYSCLSTESRIVITSSTTKTVTITPSSTACDAPGGGGGGGGGGTTTVVSTPTPTTSPTPTPTAGTTPTPTPTPTPLASAGKPTPVSRGFISLKALSLKEGDVVSATGSNDPDVYIANDWGYKRLFLNPAIFGFYGHLGGFSKVKTIVSPIRDTLVTSGLYRNCETNDKKVYGVEVTGEDIGMLHWVNTSGNQAVADDPDFFKKVFCINTKEFNWYPKGSNYTSVNQIPDYSRKAR